MPRSCTTAAILQALTRKVEPSEGSVYKLSIKVKELRFEPDRAQTSSETRVLQSTDDALGMLHRLGSAAKFLATVEASLPNKAQLTSPNTAPRNILPLPGVSTDGSDTPATVRVHWKILPLTCSIEVRN